MEVVFANNVKKIKDFYMGHAKAVKNLSSKMTLS
jgi:hypothetical protein